MNTAARIKTADSAHWYDPKSGSPCYEIIGKTTGKPRPVNIGDARRRGLVPSVTTILGALNRPALNEWKTEQAVLAILTTPRNSGETDDDFVHRVLHVEKQQDQQAEKAMWLGTAIHEAIERKLNGHEIPEEMAVYVNPVLDSCCELGELKATEQIVFGDGYAGKMDASFWQNDLLTIVDFKSTSKLPQKSYPEHRAQLAAYAKAHPPQSIQTANIYISTSCPGEIVRHINEDWPHDYDGFMAVFAAWKWIKEF